MIAFGSASESDLVARRLLRAPAAVVAAVVAMVVFSDTLAGWWIP